MYADTIDSFVATANRKRQLLRASPLSFFVANMLAGAYIGLGIILIFSPTTPSPLETGAPHEAP